MCSFPAKLEENSMLLVELEVYSTFSWRTSQIHEIFYEVGRTCCFHIITGVKSRVLRKNAVKPHELQESYVVQDVFLKQYTNVVGDSLVRSEVILQFTS